MSRRQPSGAGLGIAGGVLGGTLLLTLGLPFFVLATTATLTEVHDGLTHPLFLPALALSLRTTLVSLSITVVLGSPIAWWLATSNSRLTRPAGILVDLPIVIPPAVVGVALLSTFGRQGALGPILNAAGVQVPFTEKAVLLAQVVVSAPFFVQAASNAFRKVDVDMLVVARTLGASEFQAFLRVALPASLPGLVGGASLAWARSLGEFGATLLFAGNLPGTTQTMPLAIFTALESDVRLAVVFSLALAAIGATLLFALRVLPAPWGGRAARTGFPLSEPR
jgi:molybdate transport system permease protein